MADRKLSDLGLTARGGVNPNIMGLALDSRSVREGFLFAALPGTEMHGAEFIGPALRMGAAAIVTDAEGASLGAQALAGS
ncbi:MAG: Mur ligase domain-containing protein, partial [Microgenomates group bacterium]